MRHPLDTFAKRVEYTGWYRLVLSRMRRSIQPLGIWALVLLLTSCSSLLAPMPFKVLDKEYTYLDSRDPNSLSLVNSDPETFRVKSKIDMSWKPDIL